MTSQLQQKLSAAQDDQRSKSLSLREKAVAQKEKLLDDTSRVARVEVLDKQILLRESTKAGLENAIAELEASLVSKRSETDEKLHGLTATLDKKNTELTELSAVIAGRKDELLAVETLIATAVKTRKDTEAYLRAQQQTVDDTIANWNADLTTLSAEADRLHEEKNKLSGDIVRLEQSRDKANDLTVMANARLEELDSLYAQRAELYKAELATIKKQTEQEKQHLMEFKLKSVARLEVIASREQAIHIKEAAQRTLDNELGMRERRLNMKLGLLEIPLEG